MIIENAPTFLGLIYAIIGIIIIAVLLKKERFSSKLGIIFLSISTLFGFLFFTPMLPHNFQRILLHQTAIKEASLPMALGGLIIIIILTFIFGRVFCGYICPIGATQELVSRLPIKHLKINNKKLILGIHWTMFLIFIFTGLLVSFNLLRYFGISDFFNLIFSIWSILFLLILLISLFIYRPFCRFICPYGALLSLAAIKSLLKITRNQNCNSCEACQKICPTNETDIKDFKQEGYLCLQCIEVCPKKAIEYDIKK